jgi:hypothetical protein
MSVSNIFLSDPQATPTVRIAQLYPLLELFSEHEPPVNTLFIMAQAPLAGLPGIDTGAQDQLLLVDPPEDATTRFRLEGNVAAVFTGAPRSMGLPLLEMAPGGVAHVRIGDHFLDIYAQAVGAVICLPAVGVICSGAFGSDVTLPHIVPGSDGGEELGALRLLARLLKERPLQFFIPSVGAPADDTVVVMERLAADVAYLHGLRRVIPAALARGEALETVENLADSLLPAARDNGPARAVHSANVRLLLESAGFDTEAD